MRPIVLGGADKLSLTPVYTAKTWTGS